MYIGISKVKCRRWTNLAIQCYRRGCVCKGCPTAEIVETPCRMKNSVLNLVKQFGAPPEDYTDLIPGITEPEANVISAIKNGAKTVKEIADTLCYTPDTIGIHLTDLAKIFKKKGVKFKNLKNRRQEVIDYIISLKPEEYTKSNVLEELEKELIC